MNTRRVLLLAASAVACGQLEIGSYLFERAAGKPPGRGGSAGSSSTGGSRAGAGSAGGPDATGGDGGNAGMPDSTDGASAGEGGEAGDTGTGGARGGETGGEGGDAAGEGGSDGIAGEGGDTSYERNRSCRGYAGPCRDFGNCCAATTIFTEDFLLGAEGHLGTSEARVSLFYADYTEVTVARFARFVEAYDAWTGAGHPQEGEGGHLYIENTGWRSEWPLPASRQTLKQAISGCYDATYPRRASDPALPMNCVSWFEAFAFCIWDGKRLLTEAEWELVAKAGREDRRYPWGDEPEPTPDHAVYGCLGDPNGTSLCEPTDILPVGSKPAGQSRDGPLDVAGSVAEWVFDGEGAYPDRCHDCANAENESLRMFRGGGYMSPAPSLETVARFTVDPRQRLNFLGIRCATSVGF